MRTVVINNCQQHKTLQLQPRGKDPMGNSIAGGVIMLVPGVNLVPSVDFNESLTNPGWKSLFSTVIQKSKAPEQDPDTVGKNMLEVAKWIGEKGSGEVADKAPLAKLTPEQCQRMIDETFSSDLLYGWQREEIRPEIRRSIEIQLEKIRTGDERNPASSGR